MATINSVRLYHAALAITATLAFITGEMGIIHAWLGYGVAIIILLRLLWALSGDKQVGLTRFYPSFEGLNSGNLFTHPIISKLLMLGIIVSLMVATGTGLVMDNGKSVGMANAQLIAPALADDDGEENSSGENEESPLGETHELFANLMLLFVGLHVTYLLLFKMPLARFMLFIPPSAKK